MKIRYLGTGAAEGVPAMFCNCDFCNAVRKAGETEFRKRTHVIIDNSLSVDFPPDAYANSLKYGLNLSTLKYLLVTHSHMDHFYAHDFILRGYRYAQIAEPQLFIYGNEEVGKVFSECTAREMKPEVAGNLSLTVIKPYSEFMAGDYRVIAIPAVHSKTEDALLYYIERDGRGYLHLYDTGKVQEEALEFLAKKGAKADLVSFDCTFAENKSSENARHMGIEENMYLKSRLDSMHIVGENTKFVITHFSHNAKPFREKLKLLEQSYGVIAAYDGLEIEF